MCKWLRRRVLLRGFLISSKNNILKNDIPLIKYKISKRNANSNPKIEDAYYPKVMDFIQSLPKKAVKMEAQKMSKAQKQVARDLVIKGELKHLIWTAILDGIDAVIGTGIEEYESKASRKI